MDGFKKRVLEDIDAHGCSVIHVLAKDDAPPFAYSIGIQKRTGSPEVIVLGLKQDLAHFVVNEYNRRVRLGERIAAGARHGGFFQGFSVQFEAVASQYYDKYVGGNVWLYEGQNFDVLQIIYPTTQGVWPWDASASPAFRQLQPILCRRTAGHG
jgi:hypothetical protein